MASTWGRLTKSPITWWTWRYGAWEAERVRAGLDTLTKRQREALDLTYFKGYTNKELAEALGIPLGTAKARIRDGLIKLRDAWEEER